VIDLSVTTVKVQNWDKTISMIPTYALLSESFKNWRGMSESGGRRIKRALYIDMNSVAFSSPAQLDRFERIALIADYVRARRIEVSDYNREHALDTSEIVNGRRMTNLGTFRAYAAAYLRSHPKIHHNMTFLVRQLAPGPTGMPLEIYVFSSSSLGQLRSHSGRHLRPLASGASGVRDARVPEPRGRRRARGDPRGSSGAAVTNLAGAVRDEPRAL
jgi:miniconductance mechanosensitive channel